MDINLEPRRVVLAGNPKVSPLGSGFEVKGLDDSTRHALARALRLEREGTKTRVLLILDHPGTVKASQLFRSELAGADRQVSDSPHCNDLHSDIRGPILRLLEEAKFPKNRLGILLEATVFRIRKKNVSRKKEL